MRDEHVAVAQFGGVVERGEHARGAAGAAGRAAQTAQQHGLRLRRLAGGGRCGRCGGVRGDVVQGGDRAALQHPQRAVGVERPLGVLREAVVLLDAPAELGDRDDLVVAEHRPQRLLLGEGALNGAAVGGVLDHEILVVDLAAADRERGLLDDVAVGRDRARDDRLAEAEGALDDELVALPGGRVDREHHAGARGVHLALHDDGDVHVGLPEAVDAPVVDRARAEQRAPAAAHGVDDRVGAADVEERLVHAGKGGDVGVLGRCRRAHGDGQDRIFTRPAGQLAVLRADLVRQRLGQRGLVEQLARGHGGGLQRDGVLHVHGVQQLRQALAQPRLHEERRVCGGADDEALGHRQPGCGELAQVGALAAGVGGVAAAQARERADSLVRHWRGIGLGGNAHRLTAPRLVSGRRSAQQSSVARARRPPHSTTEHGP